MGRAMLTLLHSVPPALLQDIVDPSLCWRLLDTQGKSGSVSCGVTDPFSWVLVHKVLFVPSKSLFPQSCVSSGGSVVGIMATSKRAYAIPRSAAPRAPVPVALHCRPVPP